MVLIVRTRFCSRRSDRAARIAGMLQSDSTELAGAWSWDGSTTAAFSGITAVVDRYEESNSSVFARRRRKVHGMLRPCPEAIPLLAALVTHAPSSLRQLFGRLRGPRKISLPPKVVLAKTLSGLEGLRDYRVIPYLSWLFEFPYAEETTVASVAALMPSSSRELARLDDAERAWSYWTPQWWPGETPSPFLSKSDAERFASRVPSKICASTAPLRPGASAESTGPFGGTSRPRRGAHSDRNRSGAIAIVSARWPEGSRLPEQVRRALDDEDGVVRSRANEICERLCTPVKFEELVALLLNDASGPSGAKASGSLSDTSRRSHSFSCD